MKANKYKLSVVVAIYNLDSYLPKCLDSLVNQTLKEIEILCIDDGSTDKSGEIVDKYGKMWYINYDRSKTGFSNLIFYYIGDVL